MNETNLHLFAISVILAGGFILITEVVSGFLFLYESIGSWGILLGLGISIFAIVRERGSKQN